LSSRSVWRRVRLAVNTANLGASVLLTAGGLWAWFAEGRGPAPAALGRIYRPVVAAIHYYNAEPIALKALAAFCALFSLVALLLVGMFTFKAHLEDVAFILLGIPFYLLVACCCFLAAGLVVSLIRLL